MNKVIYNKNELTAVRPEALIKNRLGLNGIENDVIDMFLAEIKDSNQIDFTLPLHKYVDCYVRKDISTIYHTFKVACENLETKRYIVVNENTKEKISYAWFSMIRYIPNKSKIVCRIDPDMAKIFFEMKQRVYYDPKITLKLSNFSSKMIYYMMKQYEDTGWRKDSLEDFCNIIECKDGYKNNYAELNRKILKPAISEINKLTDLFISFTVEKQRRKVVALVWEIKKKNTEDIKIALINHKEKINKALEHKQCTRTEILKVMEGLIGTNILEFLEKEEVKRIEKSKDRKLPIIKKILAEKLNISERTIDNNIKITLHSNAKLLEGYDNGTIKVNDMLKFIKLSEKEQLEIANKLEIEDLSLPKDKKKSINKNTVSKTNVAEITTNDLKDKLSKIKEDLQSEVNEISYNTWIDPLLSNLKIDEAPNKVILFTPNQFTHDTIEQKYKQLLEKVFKKYNITFQIDNR